MKSIGEPAGEITAAKSERDNLAYLEWIIKKKKVALESTNKEKFKLALHAISNPYTL